MNGCRVIVFTGSVFEPYEGKGDPECRAFSPYGLSKHMSFELFRLECRRAEIGLRKFVIPNPFGPYEELRFTSNAIREWSEGRIPIVFSSDYVRDNIHVSLLAKAYRRFCEGAIEANSPSHCAPSGYVETQATFARRFAREIGKRLGRDLRFRIPEAIRVHRTESAVQQPARYRTCCRMAGRERRGLNSLNITGDTFLPNHWCRRGDPLIRSVTE